MEKSTALYQKLPLFQEKIQQLAAVMNVNLADYQIDHLALRANTEEKAKNWLTELLKCGRILSDNIVNGRPIYLIELDEPVDFIGQPVDVIELPFPKNKQYPQETWEHIEIVMPFLSHESVEDWVNRICNTFLWKDESAYKGQVIFTEFQGDDVKLTVRKNDCSYKQEGETEVIVHKYDSTLVTGACVKVSDNGQGVKNVSTWSPRNPI